MDGEIVHLLLVGGDGLEVDKGISVVDADEAIIGGGKEVEGKGERRVGKEGEGGDSTGVIS